MLLKTKPSGKICIDTEDNHGVLEKRDHEDADSQRDEDFPDFAKSNGQYQDHEHVGLEEDETVLTPLADHEHLEHAKTRKDESLPSSIGRALTEEVEELQDTATAVNEITLNENQNMPSPSQISQTSEASSSKKQKADQTKWEKNVNKSRRSNGEAYMGRKYDRDGKFEMVEKPAKVLGERCSCKAAGMKCTEVTEEMRTHILKDVWSMSWLHKEVLVKSLVHKCDVTRHRVDQSEPNRKNTLKYSLNNGSGLIPVCKKMFLSTMGLTQLYIRTKVCDSPSSPHMKKNQNPRPADRL
ncbi:Ws0399_0 protein [Plakobranchus ocellatus]|uniref:Ws0399_0 protein n=1 Tax=Plakobranchus ocellatus TaxID=259542 RepID=A0AAV4ARQ0_9GAST|nr:Ws0399_0 protein [Plakobranchus ocellatus]